MPGAMPSSTDDTTAALEMRGVGFAYDGHVVLQHVDLTVPIGSFTAIIGPNGGGKSTLLGVAIGQLRPMCGTVRLYGDDPMRARGRAGFLPQATAFDPAFPITASEVVGHGRLGRGWRRGRLGRRDHEAVRAALDEVGCLDLADRPLAKMSGGQRQRILIARALATDPDLLALDEPAAGLDPTSQHRLYELLARLAERLTVIVVSHHVNLVSHHVQQVACIHDGHLHLPGTSEIGPELRDFFPDTDNMVLVRHDHDACIPPEPPRG